MDINRIFCAEQIVVPSDLPLILKEWTKAVIREQPIDALEFSLQWFEAASNAISEQKTREGKLKQIERAFETYDIDGCGKMLSKDLSTLLLKDLAFGMSEHEIEDALVELDPDNAGVLQINDICRWFMHRH